MPLGLSFPNSPVAAALYMARSAERSFTDDDEAADEYNSRPLVAVQQSAGGLLYTSPTNRRWRSCPWRARSARSDGTWTCTCWYLVDGAGAEQRAAEVLMSLLNSLRRQHI
jgi:hypothetical protein